MLAKEIKGCLRRYKATKDIDHLIDIFRLILYYAKKPITRM